MKRLVPLFLILCSMNSIAQKAMPLYQNGIPNNKVIPSDYKEFSDKEKRVGNVYSPTIAAYFPDTKKRNGTSVIIFPGGGYFIVAMGHEGESVAKEFNKLGITAFVVKYRIPNAEIMHDKSIAPLQDAQQAILSVRKNADKYGIDKNKIGILGFSAGGHLASTLGTHFNVPVVENIGNINLRPDFMMLIYPVITFGELTHAGSRENLIGKTPTNEQLEFFSNEKQVAKNTPPTFLVHSQDDSVVSVKNSLLFYESLCNMRVKSELHIFQEGGHGFGLINPKSKQRWFEWCTEWLKTNGFL